MLNQNPDPINNNGNRIYWPELDGLRFFAFLLVFIHHQSLFSKIPYLAFLESFGWIGVDVFFVLSAFLITKILLAEFDKTSAISIKKFYIRRLLRIWPLYFLFAGFSILLHLYLGGSLDEISTRIIGLFTFSDNVLTAIYGYNPMPYIGHLWTITYEEQFYLFIPLIIPFLLKSSFRKRTIYFTLIFLLLNGVRFVFIAIEVEHPAIWVLPITHFESIVLGIVAGFGGLNFLSKKLSANALSLLSSFFFILLILLPPTDQISYWLMASYTLVGLSTICLLLSLNKSIKLKKMLSNKVLVFLGKRSYGLYVYHLLGDGFAYYVIAKVPILQTDSLTIFTLSLSFTALAAIISYKFLEATILKFKSRFEIINTKPL